MNPNPNPPVLRTENLTRRYIDGFTLSIPHLEFRGGKVYGLVGPNGSGKTTLLNLLSLLEEPDSGEIFFKEKKVARSRRFRLEIRRKMGMVMEGPILFNTSVLKNITTGLKIHSIDKGSWPMITREALSMVGLGDFEGRHARRLSRGERQRVAIARALALKPEILLLDEPFTNIDKNHLGMVEDLIKSLNIDFGMTIIFTTHDLLQAYRLSDEIVSLVDGRKTRGSPENIFSGEIEDSNGVKFVRISPLILVSVATNRKGRVKIAVPERDIILSHKTIESSARNSFRGIIRNIQMEGEIARVATHLDEGVEFIAIITRASYKKMSLSIDSPIHLTFKSTSVMVF